MVGGILDIEKVGSGLILLLQSYGKQSMKFTL